MADRNPKTGLTTGVSQKKLASEAYRAIGGVARNAIANHAIVGHKDHLSHAPAETALQKDAKMVTFLKFPGKFCTRAPPLQKTKKSSTPPLWLNFAIFWHGVVTVVLISETWEPPQF